MTPELIDAFENGDITMEVRQLTDPLRNKYWIKSGVAGIELDEQQLDDLIELLIAYDKEHYREELGGTAWVHPMPQRSGLGKFFIFVGFLAAVLFVIYLLAGPMFGW